jgi:hypothetical protein
MKNLHITFVVLGFIFFGLGFFNPLFTIAGAIIIAGVLIAEALRERNFKT